MAEYPRPGLAPRQSGPATLLHHQPVNVRPIPHHSPVLATNEALVTNRTVVLAQAVLVPKDPLMGLVALALNEVLEVAALSEVILNRAHPHPHPTGAALILTGIILAVGLITGSRAAEAVLTLTSGDPNRVVMRTRARDKTRAVMTGVIMNRARAAMRTGGISTGVTTSRANRVIIFRTAGPLDRATSRTVVPVDPAIFRTAVPLDLGISRTGLHSADLGISRTALNGHR